jgi:hypothetical protein
MVVGNQKLRNRTIFVNSFVRGLAAPTMMFAVHELPQIPNIIQVQAPVEPIDRALAGDWGRVGQALDVAIETHNVKQKAA